MFSGRTIGNAISGKGRGRNDAFDRNGRPPKGKVSRKNTRPESMIPSGKARFPHGKYQAAEENGPLMVAVAESRSEAARLAVDSGATLDVATEILSGAA